MTVATFVDVVLGLMAVEAVLLLVLAGRVPHLSRISLMTMLAAGATLMLALRAVARGGGLPEVMLWLTLGLAAHLFDLRFRIRSKQ